MSVSVNRDLNLVIPVDRADGTTVYAHSAPIGKEAFKHHATILALASGVILSDPRMAAIAGPRIAANVIEEVARERGRWDGEQGVERGLIGEVRRLTNVIANGSGGWAPVPFDEAVRRGILDDDEAEEVVGAACFFTLIWRIAPIRGRQEGIETTLLPRFDARLSPLNCTEYARSLPTSTATAPSTAKAA